MRQFNIVPEETVTRKHYIKPPSIEAISAMRRLSETLLTLESSKLLPNCSPEAPQVVLVTTNVR